MAPTRDEIVRWATAVKRNEARAPLEAFDPQAAAFAGAISDMYMGLRVGAEDQATAARTRMDAQRAQLLSEFANTDATNAAAIQNSGNYLSAIAKQLGLGQALAGPGVENNRQQVAQFQALNNANRQNQLASFDLIRNTYGDLLNRAPTEYDTLAAQDLSSLYSQVLAARAQAMANAGGGGGGGGGGGSGGGGGGGGGRGGRGGRSSRGRRGYSRRGRGGGGSSGGGGLGTDYSPEQSSFIYINPYNPPSGSTYSADYVRREIPPPYPVKPGSTTRRASSYSPAASAIARMWRGRNTIRSSGGGGSARRAM